MRVAELAEPAHDALEHARVVHLRAEVHVQPAPVEPRILARLLAGAGGVGRREAELRALVGGRDLLVPAGHDAGRDAHRDGLAPPVPLCCGRHAGALVGAVQHQEAAARGERGLDVGVGLAVAVHDDAGRVDAGAQGGGELARARDVGAEPAVAEQAQHADGAAGLAGERDVRVGVLRDAVDVGPRALAQRGGVVDVERRAEARGELLGVHPSDLAAHRPGSRAVTGQGEPSGVTPWPRRASQRRAR